LTFSGSGKKLASHVGRAIAPAACFPAGSLVARRLSRSGERLPADSPPHIGWTQILRGQLAFLTLSVILLLFLSTAMPFVTRPGIEADEALVANPTFFVWHGVPLMPINHLGALKAWFYIGFFSIVKPGPVSLRMPTVLLGAVAILQFFLLLDRTVGRRAVHVLDFSDTENLREIVADPRAAFVTHTAKHTYLPQQRALLEDAAAGAGYEEVPVEIVYDHYGRATFEVFRFRKIPL